MTWSIIIVLLPISSLKIIVSLTPSTTNTLLSSASKMVPGVSDNPTNDRASPNPRELYSSLKFSFTLLNASRIGSPVPSLPSIPILISFLAIIKAPI